MVNEPKKGSARVKGMIWQSLEAREYAYCPYGNFRVGAALLTHDERVVAVTCEHFSPCGGCRQFTREFGGSWDMYLSKPDGSYMEMTVEGLQSVSFGAEALNMKKAHSIPNYSK
ncbi:cytidine deaminase b [Hoplias malabaricus]|uniref:cytidine deaminase b n=1 Tax=Hoplias malabaricus TaxID=27720 RepID=UPI0034619C0E